MSDVSREEFDDLVARVDRLEPTTHALVNIASAELVGIRSELGDRFAHVDERFDRVEGRLEVYRQEVLTYADQLRGLRDEVGGYNDRVLAYNEQVSTAIAVGTEAAERHEAMMRRLYEHFGISEN